MTALHAAGGGLPLALHIPHVVEQIGSIAGFAAVIGLAVLSALYFSQARDLRRLREWAGRAPERAADGIQPAAPVPGRVVAVPQRGAQPVPATTAGAAAPVQQPAANGAPAEAAAVADKPAAPEGAASPDATKVAGADEASKDGEDASPDAEGAKPDGDEAAKEGDGDAPAKPGMPAPASAAAAGAAAGAGAAAAGAGSAAASAGAGAASVTGPPAPTPAPGTVTPRPGSPVRPPSVPQPQRPPGSVLPPRTGTLPPVRRLPSSNVGKPGVSQTGVLGQGPEKKKRNPLYIVLGVAGVLVLGAAAAVGVPAIVNGAKDNNSSKTSTTTKKKTASAKALPPIAADTITVSVLNATSIPGLAAQVGDQAQNFGFNLGNTAQVPGILEGSKAQQANTTVMYVPGHARDAKLVAKKLHLPTRVQAATAEARQLGGDATVIVVAGTDQTR